MSNVANGVVYAQRGENFRRREGVAEEIITNDDLAKLVETNDEWIRTRTGIGKRHVISGDETLTSLAAEASLGALKMANVNPEDIDLIIVATSSPDDLFGSACLLQSAIGAKGALAYDLTAACSGFVVGLVNGMHFIRGGGYKNVLVVGADVLSRYVDWRDRGTCILFGDGCWRGCVNRHGRGERVLFVRF